MTDYRAVNRANWDERAAAHANSKDYNFQRYAEDPSHLSDVIRFDRPRLGDLTGLRGVHLQCHIGTDTISLARLGATMTGVDFSPRSLDQARLLSTRSGTEVEFIESDVYGVTEVLEPAGYDLVFTGIGALCWLPSITRWAETVATLLKPGGRLFLREAHPILWTLEQNRSDDLVVLDLPYFEQQDPMIWDEPGTYVETDAVFQATETHEWNHGLGETVTALLNVGLTITALVEHDTVPWEALSGKMKKVGDFNEWQLADRPARLPHTFTLQAVRNPV